MPRYAYQKDISVLRLIIYVGRHICSGGGTRTPLMRSLGYEPSEMTTFSTPRCNVIKKCSVGLSPTIRIFRHFNLYAGVVQDPFQGARVFNLLPHHEHSFLGSWLDSNQRRYFSAIKPIFPHQSFRKGTC